MNQERPPLFVPALIGGTAAGVLSAVPLLNCLCCLWIIGGAMLAAALWSKDSPVSLTSGDGALVGAFTGLFAAAAHSLINIPLAAVNSAFFPERLHPPFHLHRRDASRVGRFVQTTERGVLPNRRLFPGADRLGGGLRRSGNARRNPRGRPVREKDPPLVLRPVSARPSDGGSVDLSR